MPHIDFSDCSAAESLGYSKASWELRLNTNSSKDLSYIYIYTDIDIDHQGWKSPLSNKYHEKKTFVLEIIDLYYLAFVA